MFPKSYEKLKMQIYNKVRIHKKRKNLLEMLIIGSVIFSKERNSSVGGSYTDNDQFWNHPALFWGKKCSGNNPFFWF